MEINLNTLVLEIVLTGFFFWLIVPKVRGARFTGNPGEAFLYAAVFQIVQVAVVYLLGLAAMAIGLATLGVGLIPIAFAAVFLFWLLPAVQLQAMAWLFPRVMSFDSFGASALCGLGILVIGLIAGDVKISIH